MTRKGPEMAASDPPETIRWEHFEAVELRVGTIVDVEEFPEAKIPAYKVAIDLGRDLGVKRSSARITDLYAREELVGRQVIAVTNFPPKRIGPFTSEVLITGFYRKDDSVVLAVPDRDVPNGAKLG